MIDENSYRTVPWNPNEGEDGEYVKKRYLQC